MPTFRINDAEQDALDTLPALAERLYYRIRRTMDYRTGACGTTNRISWEGFAQRLSRPGSPGIAAEVVSIDQTRRAAKHLERAGMITFSSDRKHRRLIINCLMADTDQQQNPPDNSTGTNNPQAQQPRGMQKCGQGEAARYSQKAARYNGQNPPDNPPHGDYLQEHEIEGFFEQSDAIPATEAARYNGQNPPNIRSTTVPYRTIAGAREDETEIQPSTTPNHPMEWAQYFIAQGFPIHKVQTAQTMPMFAEWVKRGITTDDMDQITLIADTKLGQQPGSPVYYRNFLTQYLTEKQRAATEAAAPIQRTGGRTHAIHQPPRKQSAVERVAAANGYDLNAGRFLDDAQDW